MLDTSTVEVRLHLPIDRWILVECKCNHNIAFMQGCMLLNKMWARLQSVDSAPSACWDGWCTPSTFNEIVVFYIVLHLCAHSIVVYTFCTSGHVKLQFVYQDSFYTHFSFAGPDFVWSNIRNWLPLVIVRLNWCQWIFCRLVDQQKLIMTLVQCVYCGSANPCWLSWKIIHFAI
jgi:hypothetical protein